RVFYSLSLHDALPILAAFALTDELPAREARSQSHPTGLFVLMGGSFLLLYALQRSSFDFFSDPTSLCAWGGAVDALHHDAVDVVDRKSTRLNSSHVSI